MKSFRLHFLLLTAMAGLLASGAVLAQQEQGGGLLSPATASKLEDIHELMEQKSYAEAMEIGKELLESTKGREYENAVVKQTIAYVYIYQDDYQTAARYLKEALDMGVFAKHEWLSASMALGQVYVALEEYRKAIALLKPIVDGPEQENVPSTAFILVANSYAQLEQFRQALPYTKQAIAREDKPRENWYGLLLAIYFELGEYRNAAETLEIMVANWPQRKRYWTQLAQLYLELDREQQALSTLALAYKQGYLDQQSDLLTLAQLYLFQGVPYKAAQVLKQGLEDDIIEPTSRHYEYLANAYIDAKEYDEALVALGKAADKADDGKFYLRQAQIYASRQQWNEVIQAVDKATDKGLEDKDMGMAYLLQGMASVEEKKYDQALRSFRKARNYEKSREQAVQWIRYVEDDLMKIAQNY